MLKKGGGGGRVPKKVIPQEKVLSEAPQRALLECRRREGVGVYLQAGIELPGQPKNTERAKV